MDAVWCKLPSPPAGFARSLGLSSFQAHLLFNRGVGSAEEAELFLGADESLLNDPMLLPDMSRAVSRLEKALRAHEPIGIFGDFDTDGVTGTAVLAKGFGDLGLTVVPYLPDRVDEGHGLNEPAIRLLHERGVSLLVTVDCGVSSVAEVNLAASLGIDTIITDHHTVPSSGPDAYAVINPKRPDSAYPYGDLTGVGMAFKVVEALYTAFDRPHPDHLMELVALGTIADVGPLTGENRYLVKKGLERLNATQSPGLRALISSAGLKPGSLDTESLAFGLIPRLNVAGRIDHPGTSLDLLTADSLEVARPLADHLERKNRERQRLTAQGVEEAREQVELSAGGGPPPPIVMVVSEKWIPGILGLIAGKLVDQYRRPAVAVSLVGDIGRASARSIPEFDIVGALERMRDLLIQYGGHRRAAGFTAWASSLPDLQKRLAELADDALRGLDLRPNISIDCEASPALLAGRAFEFIQSLAPFGEGNPSPIILTRNARVVEARQVGKGRHLKMRLSHGGSVWDAIAFGKGDSVEAARDQIDLVYTTGLDDWWDEPRFQLNVLDFRPAR